MEDQEAVDYSSDRMESDDIWAVTGGGSLPSPLQPGNLYDDGCAEVFLGGECGQFLQGQGSSGETSAEDWRVPLLAAEQRGWGSPCWVPLNERQGDEGIPAVKQVWAHGTSKGRRKN